MGFQDSEVWGFMTGIIISGKMICEKGLKKQNNNPNNNYSYLFHKTKLPIQFFKLNKLIIS